MPGQLLHRIAQRVCPDETDRVFEPLIADLQREWSDAQPGPARAFALARAYASFWTSATRCATRTVLHGAVAPVDRDMAMPAARAFACALLGITALRIVGRSNWQETPMAIALGEASAWASLGIFALVPAFMYARRRTDRNWDTTASRLLLAGLLISIAFVGWLGPALSGAAEHARGGFLDGRVQPAFASLPTVVRMVRIHATDADYWSHVLTGRLMAIADALLLALIGWRLSALRRPSILRAMGWWFGVMELVLISGSYGWGGHDWSAWRASGILVLILLALCFTRRSGSDLSVLPDPPALSAH